ncbi:exocyst complex component 4-like isoform X1 [Lytechinus variegatus]|uniref:exocyst complex component 4-like isoform X1 n=2 Tax=Lytechinus variegatus TaxID=7654 RepID=UPI001BB0E741|nr:exocyst complex component 4-like isoform X1 [Lytechinus variegatus]
MEDSTPSRTSQSFRNKQLNRLSGVFKPMSKNRPMSTGSSSLFRKPSFTGHFSRGNSSSSSTSSSSSSRGSSGGGSSGLGSGLGISGGFSRWSSREGSKKRQAPPPPESPGGSPRRTGTRSSGYKPVLRMVKTKPRLKGLSGTGLLMSVIRTLSASEDEQQRGVEKARLEKAYRECDRKLDKLITVNYDTLTKTIQAYSSISGRIKNARERTKVVKADLLSCKELLHCRRDELRKLWLEGIEQKQVLALLDQIEDVKSVSTRLATFLANKHYLHATELLTKTMGQLDGDLKGVEALSETRIEMFARKDQLNTTLLMELRDHLYEKSATTFQTNFNRGGSLRGSGGIGGDASPKLSRKQALIEMAGSARKAASKTPRKSPMLSDSSDEENRPITEDLTMDPETNVDHYIAILVESLSLLKRIPEAVEAIKGEVQSELAKIVHKSTADVADNAKQRGENIMQQNQPKLLEELLDLIFERFKCVASAHMCVLGALQRITTSGDVQLYTMGDIWSKIQTQLQMILSSYLDVRNVTATAQQATSAFTEVSASDLNTYFSRRKQVRQRKVPLFRFDMSSHAISMTNYMREQKQEFYGSDGQVLAEDETSEQTQMVCKPSIKNITIIFKPLNRFIKDIEASMNVTNGNHCTLHHFVSDFVKEIFLGYLQGDIEEDLQAATKGSESLKSLVDMQTQKTLGAPCPLLQAVVTMDKAVSSLRQLTTDLPSYADQFLQMLCTILQDYKETCYATYRGLVQPESEDKRIFSASWVKDTGINQCLRYLPNWLNLQEERKADKDSIDQVPETIEDIRERNEKESELLVTNLGDKLLQTHEVLTDLGSLRLLANLHESLEWFACRVRNFAGLLPSQGFNTLTVPGSVSLEIPPVDMSLLHSLIGLAKEFQDLADTCLLVLHLEVRLHCFFFLMPVTKQSSFFTSVDSVDPDPNVIKLSKDLTSLEEALHTSLHPAKFKYVFEGLGHLVSYLLINSSQYIKRINENGIKKMCRNIFILQQNLTNITMSRETDLDHARQYYELMYKTTDDILNSIVEQGAAFKELEYRNIINLLHRSSSAYDQKSLGQRLKKLEEIMTEAV